MPSLIRRRVSKKTGHVTWQVQIPIGVNPSGQPQYLRRSFDKRKGAKDYLDDKEAERKSGGVIKPTEDSVGMYLDEWLKTAQHSLRENTAEWYGQIIEVYLKPNIGNRKLADLQPLAIQRLYDTLLERGLSPSTVRKAHSVLHNALEQAVKWRLVSYNPASHLELPKIHREEIRPLTKDESRAFLEASREYRLGVFFELMLATGMRMQEVMGLQWKDVDLRKNLIKVRHSLVRTKEGWNLRPPKTARGRRSVPIPPQTATALGQWKRRQAEDRMKAGDLWQGESNPADGFVFTTMTGDPLERRNASNRTFAPIMKKAGLVETSPPEKPDEGPVMKPICSPRDLRHTCATLALEAGVNPKVVSERLGHASVVITLDTYSHVLPTMQEDVTEKLGAALYD